MLPIKDSSGPAIVHGGSALSSCLGATLGMVVLMVVPESTVDAGRAPASGHDPPAPNVRFLSGLRHFVDRSRANGSRSAQASVLRIDG
jgi:hypothetical protein